MKNSLILAIAALFFIMVQPGHTAPQAVDYQAKPIWLEGGTIPQVLLVLERDWKIFYPAYNNLSDLDGDGVIDIGFNPAVTYVGYFDSDSCYTFSTNENIFVRVGETTPQTASELESLIPGLIKNLSKDTNNDGVRDAGIKVPLSAHGVCDRSKATEDGSGQWHGNWLNFATTSRIDAVRKVLYGGKRYLDTPDRTILESVNFLPSNGHNWGGEIPADDLWEEYYKTSPWYDVSSFTGYTKPQSQTMHFWARTSFYTGHLGSAIFDYAASDNTSYMSNFRYGRYKTDLPLLKFAANVPVKLNFHPYYMTPLRIWDWIGDHGAGSMPNGYNLAVGIDRVASRAFVDKGLPNKPAGYSARRFNVRVEVCKKGNLGRNEKCRNYGNSYKPIGLLQEYGENQSMYFGLLTGSLDNTTRWEGGVLRHHIQSFDKYVNYSNGIIKRPGLIDTIDRFMITGTYGYSLSGTITNSYTDGTQAGNPLGEMVYEGMRYMARSANGDKFLAPSNEYKPNAEVRLPLFRQLGATEDQGYQAADYGRAELPRLVDTRDWSPATSAYPNGRPILSDAANKCAKPIILVLSEVFTDHDLNTFPSQGELSNIPLLRALKGSVVPEKFNINQYLDIITDKEKLKTSSEGNYFFWPTVDRGICLPQDLPNGLRDINGHCPSEPSLEGGYSLAAVAYYAHTHDIFNLNGETNTASERNIDFYAVGLPPSFPDITFTVDENRSITIMPITVAQDLGESQRLRTLINFFVEIWDTDSKKRTIRAKFATNFEYNKTPAWAYGSGSNNMERDIFNRFDIILLTDSSTPKQYRESVPTFINSGPLRTKDLNLWWTHKNQGSFPDTPGQPYYYAFKNPNPNDGYAPLDVSKHKVLGVAIQNMTHGSFINMRGHGGYTISGVTRPGAYIEAGYNGYDNSYYPRVWCTNYFTDAYGNPTRQTPPGPVVITADMRPDDFTSCQGDYGRANWPDRRGLPPAYRNPDLPDDLLTPWECPFAGYTDNNKNDSDVLRGYGTITEPAAALCGRATVGEYIWAPGMGWYQVPKRTRYIQVRSFEFDEKAKKIAKLPNPLWLAAKYGGFQDSDISGPGLGWPDKDVEWKRGGEGHDKDDPYNYFGVTNISELPEQLGKAFEAIFNSVATGTANASSISSILHSGLSIQTQYQTEYIDPEDPQVKINWTGSVYALFVDEWGNLREDTNNDGFLNKITSPKVSEWNIYYPTEGAFYEKGDRIVHTVTSPDKPMPTIYLCRDPKGDNNGGFNLPSEKHPNDPNSNYPPSSDCQEVKSFDAVKTVWNAARLISEADVNQRKVVTYIGNHPSDGSSQWNYGGITLSDTNDAKYEFKSENSSYLHPFMGQANEDETKSLIDYIRGVDSPKYRNRTAHLPWNLNTKSVWRLGDVINSKPIIVADPSSNYHLIYGDKSYASFKAQYARRRNVTYFGANDGMLHAVNLGYFGSLKEGMAGYHINPEPNDKTTPNYKLGEEMWAFVPTSVLPHLQWLAALNYDHAYMVDLKPYIVDVKIESASVSQPWRTIMIVGLRLGGRTIEMVNANSKPQYSFSEFFAFDITDPEAKPKFLWRYSSPYLGMASAVPAVVRSQNKWYVIIPSGPTSDVFDAKTGKFLNPEYSGGGRAYYGESSQNARITVLDALTGEKARDDLVAPEEKSFFSDTFVPMAKYVTYDNLTEIPSWSHHVVYMGLTAKSTVAGYDQKIDTGGVYRLQMANSTTGAPLPVSDWKLARMYNTNKPVTGGLNATYDIMGNLWVVFGTGRVWGKNDLVPCGANPDTVNAKCCDNHEQYIYGLKEPLNSNGYMTFEEIKDTDAIVDVSGIKVLENGNLVPEANATACKTHEALYYKMIEKDAGGNPVKRGYKKKLETWKMLPLDKQIYFGSHGLDKPGKTRYEMVVTQPKIDSLNNGRSNTIYTSFQSYDDLCRPDGNSYLHVIDTYTGLPAPYMKSYEGFLEGDTSLSAGGSQVTGIVNAGQGMATEPWVLKSGGTVYGTTAFNSQRRMAKLPADSSSTSAVVSWREVLDMGFDLNEKKGGLFEDLKNIQW